MYMHRNWNRQWECWVSNHMRRNVNTELTPAIPINISIYREFSIAILTHGISQSLGPAGLFPIHASWICTEPQVSPRRPPEKSMDFYQDFYGKSLLVGGWWLTYHAWKMWLRQWEGWHPIYDMENEQFMFETTKQIGLWDLYKSQNIYGKTPYHPLFSGWSPGKKSSNFSSLGLRERAPTSLFLGTYKVVPHS